MKAKLSNANVSPKKMNLVAGLVRKSSVVEALNTLKFANKKAAKLLYKVVASAMSNAENNFGQKREELVIEEVKVTKGQTLKRFIPVSRGRAHPLVHVYSHVIVMLKAGIPANTAPKKVVKKASKPVEAAEPKAKKTVAKAKKTTKKS
jgi:large subunit ribosomal protein L22